MRKVNFIALLVFFNFCIQGISVQLFSQKLIWGKSIGEVNTSIQSTCMVKDSYGNLYTAGNFSGTVDFDPGTSIFNLSSNASSKDMFILKLDASGSFIWAMSIGGAAVSSMAVDKDNNIILLGSFSGIVDFDPSISGVANITASGATDMFICKLNLSGDLIWAKNVGGNEKGVIEGKFVTSDNSGNIYSTGHLLANDTFDFDPGPGIQNITYYSAGHYDTTGKIFIYKLDKNGNFRWVKKIGGNHYDYVSGISFDAQNGYIYTAGIFKDTSDFDPGPGKYYLTQNTNEWQEYFVSTLDSNGEFVSARNVGLMAITDINLDKSGYIILSGLFNDTVDFDLGMGSFNMIAANGKAAFVAKYDTSFKLIWSRKIDGPFFTAQVNFDIDPLNNIYAIGSYFGSITAGNTTLNGVGGLDGFIVKLDSSGEFNWAHSIGGFGFGDIISSVVTDEIGNIYITGGFEDKADFDPSSVNFELKAKSLADVFIIKWNEPCRKFSVLSLETCDSLYINGETFKASGSYTQTIAKPDACDTVYTINLTVNYSPGLAVSQSENELTAQATNCTYQWIDCGNGNKAIPGATQAKFIPSVNGSYAVVLTGSGGCSDTSACYPVQGLSIQNIGSENFISVYPNPSDGIVKLTSTHTLNNASLRVSNLLGQTLLFQPKVHGSSLLIDISGYPSGIYNIEITEGDKSFRSKLMRE